MGRLALVPFTIFVLALTTHASDCGLALRVQQANGKETVTAKNISRKPLVAYVVAIQAKNSSRVFSGVFTKGDSILPGAMLEVGSVPSSPDNMIVDYVRAADGWTCGDASTEEAKAVVTRFAQ